MTEPAAPPAAPAEPAAPAAPGLDDASARLRSLLLAGATEQAKVLAEWLIADSFGLAVDSVSFTMDEYSLNSVSGRVTLIDGTVRFFKFHTEDGEAGHVSEYYRGELLANAGLPVELPLAVSTTPGRQIVLYELRTEPRLADLCAELELQAGSGAALPARLAAARHVLDAITGQVAVSTLRQPDPSSAGAAIHQLFYHRLADPDGSFPGARYKSWYVAQRGWDDLASRRWRINGVEYASTLAEIVASAAELLNPALLASLPVLTAHGDDHQGNIWVTSSDGTPQLRLFDPAFAGANLPALLAPVKATFHNSLAHPFWLYHPDEAARRFRVRVRLGEGEIAVDDDAELPPLRRDILESAAELIWLPLLTELAAAGQLPDNWRQVVRAALACCPLLVTNLVGVQRPKPVRFLALSRVVMAGSEPAAGESDVVSRFLDRITV